MRIERERKYSEIVTAANDANAGVDALRQLCKVDLYFLLTEILGREDMRNDWLFNRCCDVQEFPDGMLDLWAREHYKSTIITFAKTIQDIIKNPEITVGIFSHTKPIARAFLRQIKYELETNERLKGLFPEIFYADPKKEAKNWSEDNGITVKRSTNPKEATVEAHGLVDGQPTSKHFTLLVYDDVVTRESVTSPEMIAKTTEAWELSLNLGAQGGKTRYIGTRYHYNDTWATIIERGSAKQRIHPATDNGKTDGNPVFMPSELLVKKRRDMGSYTFSCQMLQDPKADERQGFLKDWLRHWSVGNYEKMNRYIVVDPANAKRKNNDYTAMFVVGLSSDKNYYVIDIVRERLNLTERAKKLIYLHKKYLPVGVGYEQYGMQADIQHIETVQDQLTYHFEITPVGGNVSKLDRIRRLIPIFEDGRVFLPRTIPVITADGRAEDLVQIFEKDEYLAFPVMGHDDMLDCLARIVDPKFETTFPIEQQRKFTPYAVGNVSMLDTIAGY